jgi:hypothetical protein
MSFVLQAVVILSSGTFLLRPRTEAREPGACDQKTIQKAKYCMTCKVIDPRVNEEGLCCEAKPAEVEICVKAYYVCSECKKKSCEEKECCKDATVSKVVIKSRLLIRCEECGAAGAAEGECANEKCKELGKRMKKTCDRSGLWPHGGEPQKD